MDINKVGSMLHEYRENKKLTLDKVAKEIGVSKDFLTFIENDEFYKLPSYSHVVNFVKRYSKLLEVDYEKDIKATLEAQCDSEYFRTKIFNHAKITNLTTFEDHELEKQKLQNEPYISKTDKSKIDNIKTELEFANQDADSISQSISDSDMIKAEKETQKNDLTTSKVHAKSDRKVLKTMIEDDSVGNMVQFNYDIYERQRRNRTIMLSLGICVILIVIGGLGFFGYQYKDKILALTSGKDTSVSTVVNETDITSKYEQQNVQEVSINESELDGAFSAITPISSVDRIVSSTMDDIIDSTASSMREGADVQTGASDPSISSGIKDVKLTFLGEAWVLIESDALTKPIEALGKVNDTLHFNINSYFSLTAGNLHNVLINIDGKNYGSLGPEIVVKHMKIELGSDGKLKYTLPKTAPHNATTAGTNGVVNAETTNAGATAQ